MHRVAEVVGPKADAVAMHRNAVANVMINANKAAARPSVQRRKRRRKSRMRTRVASNRPKTKTRNVQNRLSRKQVKNRTKRAMRRRNRYVAVAAAVVDDAGAARSVHHKMR